MTGRCLSRRMGAMEPDKERQQDEKDKRTIENFLALVPVRTAQWESVGDDRIDVLVPKFRSRFMHWLIGKRLKRPFARVHLDEVGALVWLSCDGDHSVGDIAQILRERFGERVEPAAERVSLFMTHLARPKLIELKVPRVATD